MSSTKIKSTVFLLGCADSDKPPSIARLEPGAIFGGEGELPTSPAVFSRGALRHVTARPRLQRVQGHLFTRPRISKVQHETDVILKLPPTFTSYGSFTISYIIIATTAQSEI